MGQTINSGQVTADVSGSVNAVQSLAVPSATQTLKHVRVQGSGAVATLFTATAGKTAFVYALGFMADASNRNCPFFANDGTTYVAQLAAVANTSSFFTPGIPFHKVVATETLKFVLPAGVYAEAWYWEE